MAQAIANGINLTNVLPQVAMPDEDFSPVAVVAAYEKEMKKARLFARLIGVLHTISRFLAFCNLTGATVTLLGASLPNLHHLDFAIVTCLLFVEAGHLAFVSFFLRILMRHLSYSSQDPKRMKLYEDGKYHASRRVSRSSGFIQSFFILCGIVLPILGYVRLHDRYSHTRNLKASLRTFYSFVVFNTFVALVTLFCFTIAFKSLEKPQTDNETHEQSILRYFTTVLGRAISLDLVQADFFDFFSFAYTTLGADYQRMVQRDAVAKYNKRLIRYLYAHRLGLDAVKTFLDAEDLFVQLAAVNMVGFWAEDLWGGGRPEELNLPVELLRKLADMVGTGQLGAAATMSFKSLAGTPGGARIVAEVRTSKDVKLPDQLVRIVDVSGSRSLSPVRALVGFYEQCCKGETQAPAGLFEKEDELVKKLRKLAEEAKVHRLRVIAAYFLLLMGKANTAEVVCAINPNEDAYWLTSEKLQMLDLLRSHIPFAFPFSFPEHARPDPEKPKESFVRERDYMDPECGRCGDIDPPPWAQPSPFNL